MPYLSIPDEESLSAIYYSLAAIAQLIASGVALYQIKKFTDYLLGWMFLSFGLTLMMSRRIVPLLELFKSGQYSLADAELALLISLSLMFGVLQIRKLFDHLQQQEKKLEQLAKYDFLTGALSRYAIIDQGLVEVERSLRLKRPISILILDVDKFKDINDKYGHAAGDEALVELVKICKNSLRRIDLFGRFGGDEFLAILPESGIETATQIMTRLKSEVASFDFKFHEVELKITLSVGVACFNNEIDSPNSPSTAKEILDYLIHKADLKMYQNKQLDQTIDSLSSYKLIV